MSVTTIGSPPIPDVSPKPLMRMFQGLQAVGILQAGQRLGVFDRIAEGECDVASIAAAIDADARGTRILLDALAAIGMLTVDGGEYRLTPLADAYLVTSRPGYLGAMMDILASDWAWAAWPRLSDAVRSGGTVLEAHAETPEHEFWEVYAPASTSIAKADARALADALESSMDLGAAEILEVACGSGLYSLTLLERHDAATTTLQDWANVLKSTRATAETMGVADRTSYLGGDVFDVPLGGPYDLVIASQIFHHFAYDRCLELMRRLFDALRPGGRLAINDFVVCDADPSSAPMPFLFSALMLCWSHDGEAHSRDTYERLLRDAGFAPPQVQPSVGTPSTFIIASRPY